MSKHHNLKPIQQLTIDVLLQRSPQQQWKESAVSFPHQLTMWYSQHLLLHAVLRHSCWPPAVHQSIDISWLLGPQQQTCSSGMWWPDETDGQTDTRQLHRPSSTYYAGSADKNWMRVITTSPSGDIRRYWDKIFEEFKSSKQHDNGTNWLARYDFLIVFYSDCRTTLNCCCTRYVMCLIPQPSGFGPSPVLTPGESVWVHATVSNLHCRPSVESLWVRMQNCKRLMTK